jgi:N-acetylglutamate synthase-like GNAT family acetyltransferase|tara:strand:+ start:381 stop:527 length:147 start_codon:yes stop_codon:yes gene_type:complete
MINFFKDAGGFMEEDDSPLTNEVWADAIYEEEREKRAGIDLFTDSEEK